MDRRPNGDSKLLGRCRRNIHTTWTLDLYCSRRIPGKPPKPDRQRPYNCIGQCGSGRCGYQLLGRQVQIRAMATDRRDTQSRHRLKSCSSAGIQMYAFALPPHSRLTSQVIAHLGQSARLLARLFGDNYSFSTQLDQPTNNKQINYDQTKRVVRNFSLSGFCVGNGRIGGERPPSNTLPAHTRPPFSMERVGGEI